MFSSITPDSIRSVMSFINDITCSNFDFFIFSFLSPSPARQRSIKAASRAGEFVGGEVIKEFPLSSR